MAETNPSTAKTEIDQDPEVVVDTNFFIRHPNVREFLLKNKVYTTSSVLSEIKDPNARAIAKECFQDFKILNPCKQALFFVNRFTKATGDYYSLSQTDTEVIALAIELIQKKKKLGLINKMPEQVINHVRDKKKAQTETDTET